MKSSRDGIRTRYPLQRILSAPPPRTIQRDIEYMRDLLGIPIEFDPVKNGYYYTQPGFYIKTIHLTEGELFSIALFDQLLEQYRHTPLEKDLVSIFEKIKNSLPGNVTVDASFLKNRTTFIADKKIEIDSAKFELIFSALKKSQTIAFDYRPLQKTTYMTRTLEPYHAVYQKGMWYLIGFCHDKKDVRAFSFSRMKNVAPTGQVFELPKDFSPDDYFDREIGVWLSSKPKHAIELWISGDIGTFALEHSWNSTQTIVQNADGSVNVRFETNQLPEVKRWVLGQGKTVKVIAPEELKAAVLEELAAVRTMYGE